MTHRVTDDDDDGQADTIEDSELLDPTSQREDPGCDDDGVDHRDVSVGFVLVHL
jgi:hypothetical protein